MDWINNTSLRYTIKKAPLHALTPNTHQTKPTKILHNAKPQENKIIKYQPWKTFLYYDVETFISTPVQCLTFYKNTPPPTKDDKQHIFYPVRSYFNQNTNTWLKHSNHSFKLHTHNRRSHFHTYTTTYNNTITTPHHKSFTQQSPQLALPL